MYIYIYMYVICMLYIYIYIPIGTTHGKKTVLTMMWPSEDLQKKTHELSKKVC